MPEALADAAVLLDHMNEAVLGLDDRFHLRAWNRAAERIYGWKAEEVLGQPILRLLQTEFPSGSGASMLSSLREDGRTLLEMRQVRKDGTPVAVESVSVALRDPAGRITGYVAVNRDITERKRAEEAQRKMQAQLVQSDRMASMGTLAAGVAHEINNPLAYVVANLGFAAGELRASGAERGEPLAATALPMAEILTALDEAREGAERVRAIVRDLKTFSRAGEGPRAPIDVRAVLGSSINLARNEIKHRARLVTDFAETPFVDASEHRLGQVFLNLLINAAQAIPEGNAAENEIRVSTRLDGAGRVVVEVRDTGSGIPQEHLPRIFDPFFTTKPIGVGTGLGLSICHAIVSNLGGELQVESEVGRGSTFRVLLPPAHRPAAQPSASAGDAPVPRGRILVVDDEPLVGRSIRRVLSPPHDVASESSGRAALARLEAGERFDLVICDLMMPDMTGMDLYAAVRHLPGAAERFVFLTGGAFTDAAREFLAGTDRPRIDKPFDPKGLRDLVAGVLRGPAPPVG